MERIIVVGVSSGVGKSTFAAKLGKQLGMEVCHLDTLYWNPGWHESSLEEFKHKLAHIVEKNEWIIEGNYSSTIDMRMKRADTMIYLELPLHICLYRVVKRWLMNIGNNRPDMAVGCTEKIDWKFIKFIISTYYSRKKKMQSNLQKFEELNPSNKVYQLKTKKEIHAFFQQS